MRPCKTCRYWTADKSKLDTKPGDKLYEFDLDNLKGTCHRYPPVPCYPEAYATVEYLKPITKGADFCGEWADIKLTLPRKS